MHRSREVYKTIRDEIVKGVLNPGERLIENDLVEKFCLSRGPIREAFRYLEKDGFINVIPNKGAVVTKVNAQEVKDFYAILAALECKALGWAYANLEEADLQELSNINASLKQWDQCGIQVDVLKWHAINFAFHNFIACKSGNAKLSQMINDLRKRLFRLRYWSILVDTYDDYFKGHEAIISYLRKGDPASAQKSMEDHIMKVSENHVSVILKI